MNNNKVLKALSELLNADTNKLIEIAALMEAKVTSQQIEDWLKDVGQAGRVDLSNKMLAIFLEGLILYKRGKKDGVDARPLETAMTNNIVLKKLRVAFNLKESDIVALVEKSENPTSVKEWNAYFRKDGHKNYKECPDSFLEAVIKGL